MPTEGVEGKFCQPWEELVSLVGEEAAGAFGATPRGTGTARTCCITDQVALLMGLATLVPNAGRAASGPATRS
jgi:hypothetical protein